MSFFVSLISNLLLFFLLIYQTRHSNPESKTERNYTKIILFIGFLILIVSIVLNYIDDKERAIASQTAKDNLIITESVNITTKTLSKNLENLKILNDKLFIISEKTKNIIFEREKSLEDYHKLSILLENNYKSDFDSYKGMITCLLKDKKIYINVIDSLMNENKNKLKNHEALKVKYNY
ncbi:MAG: hypothetical protein WAT79_11795, partial [Saprospiraceae bacterium]